MAREIAQHMSGLDAVAEDEATATFLFPRDFIGFQGHFPGEPILPGVCEIEAVLVMLGTLKSQQLRLMAIKLAKFKAPVGSDEEIEIRCEIKREEGHVLLVKASVSAADGEKALLWIEAGVEDCTPQPAPAALS